MLGLSQRKHRVPHRARPCVTILPPTEGLAARQCYVEAQVGGRTPDWAPRHHDLSGSISNLEKVWILLRAQGNSSSKVRCLTGTLRFCSQWQNDGSLTQNQCKEEKWRAKPELRRESRAVGARALASCAWTNLEPGPSALVTVAWWPKRIGPAWGHLKISSQLIGHFKGKAFLPRIYFQIARSRSFRGIAWNSNSVSTNRHATCCKLQRAPQTNWPADCCRYRSSTWSSRQESFWIFAAAQT